MSDQVPVWLKPAAGKMVSPQSQQGAAKAEEREEGERRGRKAARQRYRRETWARGSGMPSAAQDRRQDGESASYAECAGTL